MVYFVGYILWENKAADGPWQSSFHTHLLFSLLRSHALLLPYSCYFRSHCLFPPKSSTPISLKRVSAGLFESSSLVCVCHPWPDFLLLFIYFSVYYLPTFTSLKHVWSWGKPICLFGRYGWDLVANLFKELPDQADIFGNQFILSLINSVTKVSCTRLSLYVCVSFFDYVFVIE